MTKIICSSADYVFAEEIQAMTYKVASLRLGAKWKRLEVKEKVTYQLATSQHDAGPTRTETVRCVIPHDRTHLLHTNAAYGVVLRLRTDKGYFYVGSDQYPAFAEISSDGIIDTIDFESTSEA